jgi:hypothetical protein
VHYCHDDDFVAVDAEEHAVAILPKNGPAHLALNSRK